MATAAAIFLTGNRSASGGNKARSQRQAANTPPATIAMCRPETEMMWARPETCIARQVSWLIPARTPATSAAATAPAAPGWPSAIRPAMSERSSATASDTPPASPGSRSVRPSAKPMAPRRSNQD
jgi:hypothetical protein